VTVKGVFLASLLILSSAVPAAAQGDLGAGVSFLRDSEETGVGFTVDYAHDIRATDAAAISLVGDLGWNSFDFGSTTSFMGGVRVASRANAQFSPFGQFLIGGIRSAASDDVCDDDLAELFDESCSSTNLAFGPGVGVNFAVTPRVNLRAQVDFLFINYEDETDNATRFWFGVVIPVGRD
jgi:opacity protein-like surface antigen